MSVTIENGARANRGNDFAGGLSVFPGPGGTAPPVLSGPSFQRGHCQHGAKSTWTSHEDSPGAPGDARGERYFLVSAILDMQSWTGPSEMDTSTDTGAHSKLAFALADCGALSHCWAKLRAWTSRGCRGEGESELNRATRSRGIVQPRDGRTSPDCPKGPQRRLALSPCWCRRVCASMHECQHRHRQAGT